MKQNLISAKQDFDKYLHKNLSGTPKTSTHDSITAKESQIKEILKESNETVNLTNQEQSNSIQDEVPTHNNNTLESKNNGEKSINEERDEDSLSSILSYINDNEDTFNFSSNNFSSNDVDKSILKLTSQMKQNLISAKQDFDKYLHKNLSGKPKTSTHDFVTANES